LARPRLLCLGGVSVQRERPVNRTKAERVVNTGQQKSRERTGAPDARYLARAEPPLGGRDAVEVGVDELLILVILLVVPMAAALWVLRR